MKEKYRDILFILCIFSGNGGFGFQKEVYRGNRGIEQ